MKDSLKEVYLNVRGVLLSPFLLFKETRIPKKEEIKNILFLRHDRVGDMALSTPVFKALKIKYPSAKLTLLASNKNYEIIQNNPYVDEILIYNGLFWFLKEIRTRRFSLAIDPFLTHELKQAFMTYISGAKYRVGFENAGREIFFNVECPPVSFNNNMVEILLNLIETTGAKKEGCEPEIFLTEEEKKWASSFLSERGLTAAIKIALHPGAFYPSQRWPAVRFGEIAKRIIKEYEVKVLLFGDKGEKLLLETVRDIAGEKTEIFCGLRLRQFMALLNYCNLLICNNSGPLHIASAFRIPTVSIMGPQVTPLWLPWGKNHIVIRKKLPCSPCNRAECEDHSCMKLITVEEVMDAVKSQVDRIKQKVEIEL